MRFLLIIFLWLITLPAISQSDTDSDTSSVTNQEATQKATQKATDNQQNKNPFIYQCACLEVDFIFNDDRGQVWVFATSVEQAEQKALHLCSLRQTPYEDDMIVLYCAKKHHS